MKRLFWFVFLPLWIALCFNLYGYDFKGAHYTASYKECNQERLESVRVLYCIFLAGVLESKATILAHQYYKFSENAITGFAILSESHASIHTYPEHGSCFVDLFTCGDKCDWNKFEKTMVDYLQPKVIERKVMERE